MRFGSFVFPISSDPDNDHRVIESTMDEIVLAENAGLNAVWLTEHHFDGAVAYADPLVFGASVAMRTNRIRIGFAVVEMALHHPMRLAVQTSVLDHLSNGRLIVGVGRGSAYNEYEYLGFGINLEQGRDMLGEAEELLLKAWTGENVHHQGRYWQVESPGLRPRPFQTPHPPLVRACISEPSMVEMAKAGRPVLIGVQAAGTLRRRLSLYGETMSQAGFSEPAVETALDQTWVQRGIVIGESNQEALEIAEAALGRYMEHLLDARVKFNPGGNTYRDPSRPPPDSEVLEHAFLAGNAGTVAEQIAELKEAGVRNLMLNFNVGQIPNHQVERSLEVFGKKVLPRFSDAPTMSR